MLQPQPAQTDHPTLEEEGHQDLQAAAIWSEFLLIDHPTLEEEGHQDQQAAATWSEFLLIDHPTQEEGEFQDQQVGVKTKGRYRCCASGQTPQPLQVRQLGPHCWPLAELAEHPPGPNAC
jgi:hypothetical protein